MKRFERELRREFAWGYFCGSIVSIGLCLLIFLACTLYLRILG
nr:MAG TPA: Ellis van Creveld protein 2 like protein [Caudoviricetes sp.]